MGDLLHIFGFGIALWTICLRRWSTSSCGRGGAGLDGPEAFSQRLNVLPLVELLRTDLSVSRYVISELVQELSHVLD